MSEQEFLAWLAASEGDRQAANILKKAGAYSLAVFHFQQAAEKRLKSVIAYAGRPVFTHSLVDLLKKLQGMGHDVPQDLFHAARKLDIHYTQSRYPSGLGIAPQELYDETMATEAEQWSNQVIAFAEFLKSTSQA